MEKNNCDKVVIAIAKGPSTFVKKCSGFIVNGFRFHTKSHERHRRTQTSRVVVEVGGGNYYGTIRR